MSNKNLKEAIEKRKTPALPKPTSYSPASKDIFDELKHFLQAASSRGYRDKDTKLPYVPRPGIFQPDPPVVGPPWLARYAKTLLDLDGGTKENVKSITAAPTVGSIERFIGSGLEPDELYSNLLGSYDRKTKEIYLRPGDDDGITLPHELAHAAGYGEEKAKVAEEIMRGKKLRK